MDCASPIFNMAGTLWDCTFKSTSHIRNLQKNLECLRKEMELLNLRSEDVRKKVELENQQHKITGSVVEGWLREVSQEKNEVDAILKEGDELIQKKCFGRWGNIRLRNDLGNRVSEKVSRVKDLASRGEKFENLAFSPPRPVIEELYLDRAVEHTRPDDFRGVVYHCLFRDEVGTIGLYGKPGIGKTTQMKKINNGLIGTSHGFDMVIFVSLPNEANGSAAHVQRLIANRLQIPDDSTWQQGGTQDERVREKIFTIMKTKRFLLLLDNIQQPFNLSEIGLPLPSSLNRSKFIISTRSQKICNVMGAQHTFEVRPLEWPEALTLFNQLTRTNVHSSFEIEHYFSRRIVMQCEGFPSAIIKAGQELAGHNFEEWEKLTEKLDYLIQNEISAAYGLPHAVYEFSRRRTVGLDYFQEKVRNCLTEDAVGIVGLYGRGGLGKTTLMSKITLYLFDDFDTIIWVEEATAIAVQQAIANKLHIPDERAREISNIMRDTRLLLLLDNVDQPFDLSEIGVPLPNSLNRSKVIISTRSQRICHRMGAQVTCHVEPLKREEAFTLFKQLIGEYTVNSSPRIKELTHRILGRCHGFPSAIIKAGRALAGRSVEEWELSTQELEDLIQNEISDGLPQAVVEEMHLEHTVGLDSLYNRVCKCLIQDYEGAIIGLYGVGGVGKTTLMKKINNEFLKTSYEFDIVLWVSVSKQASVGAAQEVIRSKLKIPESVWQNKEDDEKPRAILDIMETKRFVLLLDDVWEPLDLLKIGVPLPDIQNGSKVIITTRSTEICHGMGAPLERQFRVEVLEKEDALALFRKQVGKNTLTSHPCIPKLSEKVAERCKGLPLALVIVGRAMIGKNSPLEWDQAIEELDACPAEIGGIEKELFHVLKVSYDGLRDDITKYCFIYHSLFPKEYKIRNDELIEHWIGEGLLDGEDIFKARRRGLKIIEELKNANLLEEGDGFKECTKMHNVIHDMAIWIAQECGKKMNKILVCECLGLVDAERVTNWKEAERISLWGRNIEKLPEAPHCSNLQTLCVRECIQLKTFPGRFFQSMPGIRVLDLSGTHCLTKLPDEIDGLMKNLEYINLSMTRVAELPTGMAELRKLRCLVLDGVASPLIINKGLISGLSSLQLFSMYDGRTLSQHRIFLLEELESKEHVNEISLSFHSLGALKKLLTSYKLQGCIRRLSLCHCKDITSLELPSIYLKYLETFLIFDCPELGETKINVEQEGSKGFKQSYGNLNPELIDRNKFLRLRHVKIWSCPKILNLTWLIYAVCLESLDVQSCESMGEVISSEYASSSTEHANIFTRLASLVLGGMPMLTSIFDGALHLASLEVITVINCPNLKRLPLNSNSATNRLKKIEGDLNWWNLLEWEDGSSMEAKFVAYFSPRFLADPIYRLGEMKGKKKVVVVEQGSTSGEAS